MLVAQDYVAGDDTTPHNRSVVSVTASRPSRHMNSAEQDPTGPADYSRWVDLVRRIQAGEDGGMKELYNLFAKGVRFYLCRQLGPQELDDKVHDTFLIVVQAIRRGDLREPERLMGFVRTVARRQVAAHIDSASHRRKHTTDLDAGLPIPDQRLDPEDYAVSRQKVEIMKEALREISDRDREILVRFYLREQSQQQICEEMDLTDTQFRLLKSRAKARFAAAGKKRIGRLNLSRLFLRASAGGGH